MLGVFAVNFPYFNAYLLIANIRTTRTFVEQKWYRVKCGDFIKLHANETIPADIVLLHSNDISGICHIETSNLDGESNLKQREIVNLEYNNVINIFIRPLICFSPFFIFIQSFKPEFLSNCFIEVELPNREIYKFNGTM